MQVLQYLIVNKICTIPLRPQSDGMVEHYIKTVDEHMWKVFALHQRGWDAKLAIFLLVYRASTHDTMGLTPSNLVFGRKLHLPRHLLFTAPPNKEQPKIDHAADLVDQLHNIHDYAHQHLKLTSDRMKTRYHRLAKC
jgi:hypothetical protein